MKFSFRIPLAASLLATIAFGQIPDPLPHESPAEVRLPNGKLQKDEILKAEHQKNLDDAADLVKLSEELKADLEKNTQYVLSVSTIKKSEEIEKLARRIRSRMKRY